MPVKIFLNLKVIQLENFFILFKLSGVSSKFVILKILGWLRTLFESSTALPADNLYWNEEVYKEYLRSKNNNNNNDDLVNNNNDLVNKKQIKIVSFVI